MTNATKPDGKQESGALTWVRAHYQPLLLWGIFLLFLLLRLRYLTAPPAFDEARFFLVERAFPSGTPQMAYHDFFYIHPPAYLLLCGLAKTVFGESLTLYRLVSLAFSAGSFFVLWHLVRKVSGGRIALFTCLALALMPAASSLDAWAKEDAACMFFMLCALLSFLDKKYLWGGLFFGLSLISKENGAFLLYFMVPYLFLVKAGRPEWRGLALTSAVAFLLSSWWYLFLSDSKGHFLTFFTGSNPEAAEAFNMPWHAYLTGTLTDVGWVLLPVMLLGAVLALRVYLKDSGKEGAALPVIWAAACYLFLSFSRGKPVWMVTVALPACAWLAGYGLDGIYGFLRDRRRGRAITCAALVLLLAGALGVNFYLGGSEYLEHRDPVHHDYTVKARQTADIINSSKQLPADATLLLEQGFTRMNPVLIYYLRPGITYSLLLPKLSEDMTRLDLLKLWMDEGADAGFFEPGEGDKQLAEFYWSALGGSLIDTPSGYFLVP